MFLVSSRGIRDARFAETVILLTEYDSHGAMGLVINRPTSIRLSELLPEVRGLKQRADVVYVGGPVNPSQVLLLIRSRTKPADSFHVFGDVYMSGSLSELERLVDGSTQAGKFRAYAGYAGWSSGQLDLEISRGDWHLLRADSESIFEKESSEIWPELIEKATVQWVKTSSGSLGADQTANSFIFPPVPKDFVKDLFINLFASSAALGTLCPFASSAVIAAENLHPVP